MPGASWPVRGSFVKPGLVEGCWRNHGKFNPTERGGLRLSPYNGERRVYQLTKRELAQTPAPEGWSPRNDE